jgi:hypothetical protein
MDSKTHLVRPGEPRIASTAPVLISPRKVLLVVVGLDLDAALKLLQQLEEPASILIPGD